MTLSQHAGVDRGSGDSSPASSVANHTKFRRSSAANNDVLVHSPDRDPSARKKSIQDFTQDWINQYLSGQPRTERHNWLSDDSESEAPSFLTAQNQFADDTSDDWLGLEEDIRDDEDVLKTPTLADFVGRKAAARSKLREKVHKRGGTLRQEDFWGFAYDQDPPQHSMSDPKEPEPSVDVDTNATSPVEKPLPPPPMNGPMESPTENPESPSKPDSVKRQASDANTSSAQTSRRRKKLNWKGKACIIELPADDKRGAEESGYSLLTPADVQQRLKMWEDEGWDVRGFSIGAEDDPLETSDLGSNSRALYPDPVEIQKDAKSQNCVIHFPDKAVWDSYVAHLQEEKLRALGVSFGDEEEQPSLSPSVTQNTTPFPGLVSSPPIPTASAGSNPLAAAYPFSPHFGQSTTTTSAGMGSLASPASQFSVQTPLMGVDQNFMPGYPFQFQPTPPAQSSMTPQSLINARHNSSAGPGALPNLTSMLSPVSPLHDQGSFLTGLNDSAASKGGFDDHGLPFPTPQTPVNAAPDHFHASNVEIAQPTPRGHGHNLSETLQRGLDQMNHSDYHLEESIERQLDEEDREASQQGFNADLLKSRWALPDNELSASQQPSHSFSQQPHQFYGQQFSQDNAHEGSEIDTNPSISGTPQGRRLSQALWHEPKTSAGSYGGGHRSKLSTSSLNVEAKEFNPGASSFAPQTSFASNAFQFGGMDMDQHAFGFTPATALAPVGLANGDPKSNSGGFQFSAASFNVDAPAFNPPASLNSNASSNQPSDGRAKIFGDIDLSEITKQPKKSKAIPIVRPDDAEKEKKEDEPAENEESARPVPTDRHKRARRGMGHAEGEARYSISTHPLGETGNAQASNSLPSLAEGKENELPEENRSVERKGTPLSEATTWTLFDVKNEGDGIGSSPVQVEKSKQPNQEPEGTATQEPKSEQAPTEETGPKSTEHAFKGSKDSSQGTMLSPTAKPFEFKPAVPEFVPLAVQPSSFLTPKPVEQTPTEQKPAEKPDEKKEGGLMASRFAAASPPAPAKDEPARNKPVSDKPVPQEPSQAAKELVHDSAHDSPDDDELNAVMEQLNDDSDVGIERQSTPLPPRQTTESVGGPTKEQRFGSAEARSEAPSPSPGGGQRTYKLDIPASDLGSNATFSTQKSLVSRLQSPVRQLITENDHVSDWDDMISSGEDEKFMNRNRFFDRRINDLVGSAIDERLSPLERALGVIQQSVASIASGTASRKVLRTSSAEMEDSDADDEDDGEHEGSIRERSPNHTRDRKLEMLKNVVMEALVTHDLPQRAVQQPSHSEMGQLKESIAELQALTIKKLAQDPVGDMREILQETLAKQLAQQAPRLSDAQEIGADSLMLQIDGLKSMLRSADERAEDEYRMRRETQDAMAELQKLLKASEEDAARHSAAAEDAEARLLQFKEEKIPYFEKMQFRTESLSEESETLKVTIAELSSKNIALEGTLDEHRVSSDNFRRRLESAKDENKSLHETVEHLRMRMEDSMSVRQNLTEKLDRLEEDMVRATGDITREQASWRRREEEHTAKYNELRADHTREVKLREKLEQDVKELEEQEREASKLKFVFGQSQQENARLEELVSNLRSENHDLQIKASRFEREFNEARESSRLEIQRVQTSMEADLESSNSQVNIVRAELEAQINRLQNQLDNVRMDADTSKERYEMLLEEAKESKSIAVASVTEAKDLAIDEQRKMHERAINDLRERHARVLHNSSEDRERGERHLLDRLALSDDKAKHLQERAQHLEEKLEIAQSAARAAAEAAQNAKVGPITSPTVAPSPRLPTSPSMSFSKGSMEPEKISPQALRESILVLQDQLQQRETRIEELEQEVSKFDKDAPNKLKEKDTEITWLRELLGVRIDDLQDIIRTLSQPSFNKHAVRDAAIRLKANLQMQQQERTRAMADQGSPLPSISDLAASPRNLPLAAAAAWGNWRKSRENVNVSSNPSDETPSKSSNTGGLLSGLLTPPGSHVRPNTPQTAAPARTYSESRPLRGFNSTPRRGTVRQEAPIAEPPKTPPLLRRSSYDHDAEPANYEEEGHFAADDIESTADAMVSAKETGDDGPFGPQIGPEE